jgi:hypothetical protein
VDSLVPDATPIASRVLQKPRDMASACACAFAKWSRTISVTPGGVESGAPAHVHGNSCDAVGAGVDQRADRAVGDVTPVRSEPIETEADALAHGARVDHDIASVTARDCFGDTDIRMRRIDEPRSVLPLR